MAKRTKTPAPPKTFNVADYKMTVYNLGFLDGLLWTYKDYRELGIKLKTPKIITPDDEIPENIWAYPFDAIDDHEDGKIRHLVSGICNGRVGVAGIGLFEIAGYPQKFDEEDVVAIFEDPNDLIIFKLTMPR